jgi:hypothetical protein
MIRAILSGTKTQTRRIVKPTPSSRIKEFLSADPSGFWGFDGKEPVECIHCNHGEPGDRLWVREAFMHEPADYCWEASVSIPCRPAVTTYRADIDGDTAGAGWKPSIHMPRSLSRITLEITSIRVERLNDINEADAIAEGIDGCEIVINGDSQGSTWRDYESRCDDPCEWYSRPKRSYQSLWEQINGPGSWAANPWVWCISFRRLT